MIYTILLSNLNLLLNIVIPAAIIFLFLSYKIIKSSYITHKNPDLKPTPAEIGSEDFAAIAGDNPITSQLDLARAYIEIGQHDLAKTILKFVATAGNPTEKNAANELITLLEK